MQQVFIQTICNDDKKASEISKKEDKKASKISKEKMTVTWSSILKDDNNFMKHSKSIHCG